MAYFMTGSRGSHWPAPHHGHVAEYQQSGIPFVTGSTGNGGVGWIDFPFVTRFIIVSNESDTDMKIGFTETGIGANQYHTVQASQMTDRIEVKCTRLYVNAGSEKKYSIIAGLTNVQSGSFPTLTTDTTQGL